MLGLTFPSKLGWGSHISIAKTASKKIWPLVCSMKFFSPKVALYLYKSTIPPSTKLFSGNKNRFFQSNFEKQRKS